MPDTRCLRVLAISLLTLCPWGCAPTTLENGTTASGQQQSTETVSTEGEVDQRKRIQSMTGIAVDRLDAIEKIVDSGTVGQWDALERNERAIALMFFEAGETTDDLALSLAAVIVAEGKHDSIEKQSASEDTTQTLKSSMTHLPRMGRHCERLLKSYDGNPPTGQALEQLNLARSLLKNER